MIERGRWTLVVALFLALALDAGCAVDYTVTDAPEDRDLTTGQIRSQLRSGNFREKLEARKQIEKLEREPRLKVLTALSEDEDMPTRTIAVQELGKMLPDPAAREVLVRMAAEDPAPDLRDLAREKIAPADAAPAAQD